MTPLEDFRAAILLMRLAEARRTQIQAMISLLTSRQLVLIYRHAASAELRETIRLEAFDRVLGRL